MSRVDRAAAIGLALDMLGAPSFPGNIHNHQPIVEMGTMPSISSPFLVFDSVPTQEPSPAVTEPQGENLIFVEELNQKDVELINNLVGSILSPTPETTLMQERLTKSPEDFLTLFGCRTLVD